MLPTQIKRLLFTFLCFASLSAFVPAGDKITGALKHADMPSFSADLADMVAEAKKALVLVKVGFKDPKKGRFVQRGGSGFVVDTEHGYIVTNEHVVSVVGFEADIDVRLANSETYEAKVVGSHKGTDLAVIQIVDKDFYRKGVRSLQYAEKIRVGEFAIAVGAPFSLKESVTMGVISAVNRIGVGGRRAFHIQTDAALNPGNSGGPLLNLDGEVVGVNVSKLNPQYAEGVGFAIQGDIVKLVTQQIIENSFFRYSYLGVTTQELHTSMRESFNLDEHTRGALVTKVNKNSPASRAGIKSGDVIVAIHEEPMRSPSDVMRAVVFLQPNSEVKIDLYRDGELMTVEALLEASKEDHQSTKGKTSTVWKLTLEEKFSLGGERNMLQVRKNNNVKSVSLLANDLIISVDNMQVQDLSWFKKYLRKRDKVVLYVQRYSKKYGMTYFFTVLHKPASTS